MFTSRFTMKCNLFNLNKLNIINQKLLNLCFRCQSNGHSKFRHKLLSGCQREGKFQGFAQLQRLCSTQEFNQEFEEITIDKFKPLITDEYASNRIQEIICEYEYEKYTTLEVASTVTIEQMEMLLKAKDSEERRKLFSLFRKKESTRNTYKERRRMHSEEYWKTKHEEWAKQGDLRSGIFDANGKLVYGLWHNSVVGKVNQGQVKSLTSQKMRHACLFGHKLVVDMDYEKRLPISLSLSVTRSICKLYSVNRFQIEQPFDLWLCNVDMNDNSMKRMDQYLPNWNKTSSFLSFHQQSYLDLFPRKDLVYITPFAKHILDYNPDDIYVIPGLSNHIVKDDYLFYKSTHPDGIRTARIPFTEHVLWKPNFRIVVTLDMIASILSQFSLTNNWSSTLNNCCSRLIKSLDEINEINNAMDRVYQKVYERQSNVKNNGNVNRNPRYKIEEIIND